MKHTLLVFSLTALFATTPALSDSVGNTQSVQIALETEGKADKALKDRLDWLLIAQAALHQPTNNHAIVELMHQILLGRATLPYTSRELAAEIEDARILIERQADRRLNGRRSTQTEAEAIVHARQQRTSSELPNLDSLAQSGNNELIDRLAMALKNRPYDLENHRLLARGLALAGRFIEAHAAEDTVLEILGDNVTPEDHLEHAELMIQAAQGYVSPESIAALVQVITATPENPRARYYTGLALAQNGESYAAYITWSQLLSEGHVLSEGHEDAPWIAEIYGNIDDLAVQAGIYQMTAPIEGSTAPFVSLVNLREDPAPVNTDFRNGQMKLVIFWASWCDPCRYQAPILKRIADEMGISIFGVNYKDQPEQAIAFLDELGDPFSKVGADETGRSAFNWGVTGIPETFVIDGAGRVLLRYAGPITEKVFIERIFPLLNGESGQ